MMPVRSLVDNRRSTGGNTLVQILGQHTIDVRSSAIDATFRGSGMVNRAAHCSSAV